MNEKRAVARRFAIAAGCVAALAGGAASAETAQARLVGFDEVPSVSTAAGGRFKAKIDETAGIISWELEYEGLQADALQSHIHLGQRHTNGGITVFLCTNLGNGPAGTQACPARTASLNGTIVAASVIGPGGAQQLPAGAFDQLVRAIRAGATYANVHTTASTGGEIRGQIKAKQHGHRD